MSAAVINDTGVRGFLKWLQSEQPGIYKKVAQQVSARVPGAFTDYHMGGWRVAGLGQTDALSMLSVDSSLVPIPDVDVSDAANSGGISSSWTNTIGDIVKGISTLYLTKQQADIQQQVVNTQLQRAAAGLPPLPTSLANLGVPQVSVGLSGDTGIGIAVAVGIGLLLVGVSMFKGGGKGRR